MDSLDHRLGGCAEVEWQQPNASLLDRLGGRAGLDAVVEAFYDRVERDPALRMVFPNRPQRDPLKRFLGKWLGEQKDTAASHHAGRGLRRIHCPFVITSGSASRWLRCMSDALEASGIEAAATQELLGHLGLAARGLVNARAGDAPKRYLHAHCGDKRALAWAKVAARGDLAALQAGVAETPALARERGPDGRTLLWEAARNGRREVIDFLLDHGGDVNAPGAVTKGSFFPPSLAEPRDTLVMVTPYCLARWRGYDELAAHLLNRGAKSDIFTAAYLGDVVILTSLLDRCPEAVAVTDPADDYFGSTLLMHAVAGCQYEVSELLVDKGAEVHAHSCTLLTYAVTRNHLPLVELLLANGAEANQSAALGPLTGDMSIAKRLCESGYSVNDHGLLGRACRADVSRRDPDIVRRLVSLGADNANQQGALHGAALGNMTELVEVLLDCGADPDAVDEDGRTPLHRLHATRAKTDSAEVITLLLDGGAAIDAVDHAGTTPLCHAVRRSRVEAVKLLLARSADPDRHGPGGKSPREAARRGKRPRNETIRALLGASTQE